MNTTIYTPHQQQQSYREWLKVVNDWVNPYSITLTFKNPQKVINTVTSNLKRFLHKVDRKFFGNAAYRYNKRVQRIPVIEGTLNEYDGLPRIHHHVLMNRPEHISHEQFKSTINKQWVHGSTHIELDTTGYWIDYITKFHTKDMKYSEFAESLLIEHMAL